MKCRSEWQSPATEVRIRTSRGPGLGTLTSSITSGLLTSCRTAAFIGVSSFLFIVRVRSSSPLPKGEVRTLRCRNQFANLGHPDAAFAEQMVGDGALDGIFREPERVTRRYPMVDDHARQQQPPGIAAHLVDAAAFPSQRYRTGDMIQQAGGAPRVGLVFDPAGDVARKATGALGQIAQTIAPSLRHIGAVVEAGVQIGGESSVGTVAADRAFQRIDRDDIAGAFPDRAEMGVAQQPGG